MKLSSLFDKGLIFLDFHFNTYDEIIDFVSEKIAEASSLAPYTIKEALIKRENLGTTLLDHKLALPHGYVDYIEDILVLFIRLDKDLFVSTEYKQMHIKYVFAIITSKKKAQLYLKVLSTIAQLVTTSSHILDNAKTAKDLIEAIEQKQVLIDEYLRATDLICCKAKVELSDTISKAVDLMKKFNVTFLPVIDNNETTVGVIDLADLICATFPSEGLIPENLSLIDEIGPRNEFFVEPIKHFWENEEKHIVRDHMRNTDTYLINGHASYVDIVLMMTKYHHRYLVVTDDKYKAVGIIDTGDIVHKMIRA